MQQSHTIRKLKKKKKNSTASGKLNWSRINSSSLAPAKKVGFGRLSNYDWKYDIDRTVQWTTIICVWTACVLGWDDIKTKDGA